MGLFLAGERSRDELLETDPFALLIGMVLDQQIPMERAFSSPGDLKERLGGTLEVHQIADMDPERLRAAFAEKPALHRFPGSMADRVQQLAKTLVESFDADAASVWTKSSDGAELLKRVRQLPGFGEQKARIFVALLGKRLGVRPSGWDRAAGAFAEKGAFLSIADIDGPAAYAKVRAHKREMKAAQKAVPALETTSPARSTAKAIRTAKSS